jgi:hypothetical protein
MNTEFIPTERPKSTLPDGTQNPLYYKWYYEKTREARLASKKRYCSQDHIKEMRRKRDAGKKEERAEYARLYYIKNRDVILAQQKLNKKSS